jgi:hypothetical protein
MKTFTTVTKLDWRNFLWLGVKDELIQTKIAACSIANALLPYRTDYPDHQSVMPSLYIWWHELIIWCTSLWNEKHWKVHLLCLDSTTLPQHPESLSNGKLDTTIYSESWNHWLADTPMLFGVMSALRLIVYVSTSFDRNCVARYYKHQVTISSDRYVECKVIQLSRQLRLLQFGGMSLQISLKLTKFKPKNGKL